uniref:ankyrin repeat domain-containing protein n=1 Tax=Orientia tsutsugamushi TaxID=784 RepID=UPI0007E42B7F
MNNYLQLRARLLYASARNIFSSTNKHPLPYAAKKGYIDVVKHLIDHGINVNTQNQWNNTALHFASHSGNTDMVKLLLNNNANPNLQDVNGNTSLHFATAHRHIDIIRLLLNHEADVNLLSRFGETALEIANNRYHNNSIERFKIMKLLITHMVKTEHCNAVDTSSQGFVQNKRLVNASEALKKLEQQCHEEINQMKSIYVCSSCFSFFDIFVLQKDINTLARCANNPDIVLCQDKFSMYSSFIQKSIEKGKAR